MEGGEVVVPDLSGAAAGAAAAGGFVMIVQIVVVVLTIIGLWKLFSKAGEPGWACIVPIYNIIVMLKVAGKPAWWFLLFLIPVVNFVVAIMTYAGISKNFGRGVGTTLGLILLGPIFFIILGFGSAEYLGGAEEAAGEAPAAE